MYMSKKVLQWKYAARHKFNAEQPIEFDRL